MDSRSIGEAFAGSNPASSTKSIDINRWCLQLRCMLDLMEFAEEQGLEVSAIDYLINNPVPISIDEARVLQARWALRWRLRKCRGCESGFDISLGGLYYLCHECVEEAFN